MFVSPLVYQESERGNHDAAQRRVAICRNLPMLDVADKAYDLAASLLDEGALSASAYDDAMHIALAAIHGINYLLTWNCRHIDNAENKPVIRSICAKHGYTCPEICTPEELMGEEYYD